MSSQLTFSNYYTFYCDIDLNAYISNMTSPILSSKTINISTPSNPSTVEKSAILKSIGNCSNTTNAFTIYGPSVNNISTDFISNSVISTSCSCSGCNSHCCKMKISGYSGSDCTVYGYNNISSLNPSGTIGRCQNCNCSCGNRNACVCDRSSPTSQGSWNASFTCWIPNQGSNSIQSCIYNDKILIPKTITYNPILLRPPQILSTGNLYVTFSITYLINYPNISLTSQNIINLITFYDNYSLTSTSKSQNITSANQLIKDYCNNNNANLSSEALCSFNASNFYFEGKALKNLSGITFCLPTANQCQQGWLNYCNNVNTIGSDACYSFFSNSYTTTGGSTGTLDAKVQEFLSNTCVNLFVDKTNNKPNTIFLKAMDNTQNVCGCWFANSTCNVYPNFVNTLASVGFNEIANAGIECYYPYCLAKGAIQPVFPPASCNLEITQCYSTTMNNLSAGTDISNVTIMNNVAQHCGTNSSSSNNVPTSITAPSSSNVKTSNYSPIPSPTPSPDPAPIPTPVQASKNRKLIIYILIVVFIVLLILGIILGIVFSPKKKQT